MSKKQFILKTGLIFSLLTLGSIYAQTSEAPFTEQNKSETNTPKPIELSAKIFANWHSILTESTDSESGQKNNTFQLERIYVTIQKQFDDVFSAKIMLDAGNEPIVEEGSYDKTAGTIVDGKQTSKYRVFIKNAYVEAKKSFGDITLNASFGLIGTPVIGYCDKQSDQRWIQKNFIDDSKNILPDGSSIDSSADMGASLAIGYNKILELTFAITNGEGFKKTNEEVYTDDDNSKNTAYGKAYYGLASLKPLEQLTLAGFYRYEGTSINERDNHKGYYGAGFSWKDNLFKAGVNYVLPFQKIDGEDAVVSGTTDKKEISLAEAWLNITPEKLIGIPVYAMARYAYAEEASIDKSKITYMGAGLGYQFHKNFRIIAWYNQSYSEPADEAKSPNPEKQFAFKAEIIL